MANSVLYPVTVKQPLSYEDLKTILASSSENETYELFVAPDICVEYIADGRAPLANSVCFLEQVDNVEQRQDVLYILPEKIANVSCIIATDPRSLFIKLLAHLKKYELSCVDWGEMPIGIHESAQIHPSAVIEPGVSVGENSIVEAGCVLKRNVYVGKNTVIRENTTIGCAGIAIYLNKNNERLKFPHLSGVYVGDDVEIGANVVICGGTLKPTEIGNNTIIGNLSNIGHGVVIQDNVWMSVGTLIGGNSTIKSGATIGLGSCIKDNRIIEQNSSIGMGSVVIKNTVENTSYFGNPAKPFRKLNTGPAR